MTEQIRRDEALPPVTVPRSVVGAITPYASDLELCTGSSAPEWLHRLPIPIGWQRAQIDGDVLQPTRTTVCGERQQGGWDGCDTLTLYTYSGSAPADVIERANDWTLQDLQADSVATQSLGALNVEIGTAVRSNGYLTVAGQRLWAQYSTYCAFGSAPRESMLLLHNVFIGADVRARLRDDIAELTDTVHSAFLELIDTVDNDPPTAPLPIREEDQDGP